MSADSVDSSDHLAAGHPLAIWRWLTKPPASVKESKHRQKAWLLSSLLVPLIPLALLVLVIRMLTDPAFTPSPVALIGVIILGGAYALSRTRYYLWGTILTLSAIPSTILIIAITNYNPTDFKSLLAYLVLGVLLGSTLLSARGTLILGGLSAAAILSLPVLIPEVTILDIVSPLTFFVLMAISIALTDRYRDIVEFNRQEELSDSEERYHILFEYAPDACYLNDPQGIFIECNKATEDMLGYRREKLIGERLSKLGLLPPSEIQKAASTLALAVRGNPTGPDEFILNRKDGTQVEVEVRSYPVTIKGQNLVLGIARDITKRKHSEVALRDSEERLRNIINAIPLGMHMYELEPDGRLVFTGANPAADAILGIDNEQFVGKTIEEAFPPLAETEAPERYREVAETNNLWRTEQINYEDNQITGAFEVHAFQTSSGKMVATFQDITKRKQNEAELIKYRLRLEDLVKERTADLEAANRQLQALARLKDEFVSNVSHELRTPLTNLKLYHQLLNNNPKRISIYLETLERETNRLEHTIESLLALSRIDQKELPLRETAVDLNKLVSSYVADRPLLAESKGLTLTFQQGPDLPPISADGDLLGQVLGILMTNALNYTPSGGNITISTQMKEEKEKRWAGFGVSDTGPGIPLDEQDKLFERFFRGTVGRESGAEGTGLGLAIAREIIDLHDGRIEVKSAGIPGQGTSFWVWLPV